MPATSQPSAFTLKTPKTLWVAVQGALYAGTIDRGVYKSTDGGKSWKKMLYVNPTTGAADLSLDVSNPRILYAGMWDYQRKPWQIRSGGPGSGIWKSVDGGENWEQLKKGLPEEMGKVAVDVSPANPMRVYANIEAEKGGVFRSDDGGKSWKQTNSQRFTITRAWYYTEIFADPVDENKVYVLNAPMLKSIDGGKSFQRISNPHSDQHDLWINPANPENIILGNDGGACVTFNGGKTWSTQANQPTAQFYRVITDRQFPYRIYAGQQDNSTVSIASKTRGGGIGIRDWHRVAGGESAFVAFDPDNPQITYGNSIQGFTDRYDSGNRSSKDIMAYPQQQLGTNPEDMKYRFNWNPPLVAQAQDPSIIYEGAQLVLRTADGGQSWTEISPDLTRNDSTKHGNGGIPFTNEAAGGEVYNTISYIACSPHQAGVIWVGTDDGFVHLTQDEGKNWKNVTPPGLPESLINAIEVSPHNPARAYLAVTRYKFNDLSPMIYMTEDYGASWRAITTGIASDHFVRVVREDPKRAGLLYAGTERGLYLSFDAGANWQAFQSNLPQCPITDLCIADNDLVLATSGRAFWVLDDLGAFQQSPKLRDTTKMQLIEPKSTHKYTLSAGSRPGLGQNPKNGVTLDYYLPSDWEDSLSLSLEILDAQGNIIRSYSNEKVENFKSWEGGPEKPQQLPAKKGFNRFNWNLFRDALPSVDQVFIMGGYRGHLVSPGNYIARLKNESDMVEARIEILPDPTISAKPEDYKKQQRILSEIDGVVEEIHQSVTRLRSVKGQLESKLALIKEMEAPDELGSSGEAILEAITKWEEQLIQPRQKTFQDVINFRNQLSAELLFLKGHIDTPDPRPTAQALDRFQTLKDQWSDQKIEMEFLIKERIGGFNRAYQTANLPALIVPE